MLGDKFQLTDHSIFYFQGVVCVGFSCTRRNMLSSLISSISQVSSSITNQGAPAQFKFVIGEMVEAGRLFEQYQGRAKNGLLPIALEGAPISVFVFRKKIAPHLTPFAQTAMRKLVSLRHPSVLRVLDSAETDSGIFLATEWVERVGRREGWSGKNFPVYGLHQVMTGLHFLHADCRLVHGSVGESVFVTRSGSFRIGGFELARSEVGNLVADQKLLGLKFFCRNPSEADLLGLLYLVAQLAAENPAFPNPPYDARTLGNLVARSVPPEVGQFVGSLVSLGGNFDPHQFPFFTQNEEVAVLEACESIHLRSEAESVAFLDSLTPRLDRLGDEFVIGVVLESLLTSVLSIGSLVASAVGVIMAISRRMKNSSDFQLRVQPKLAGLFALQDRAVRFRLLTGLPKIVSLLDPKILESQILIDALSGFSDSHPSIREATMGALVEIASAFSSNAVERRLIPNLVKLLRDPESGIRTKAISAIGSVTQFIDSTDKREDVVGASIVSGLKDPFSPAKLTALHLLPSAVKNPSERTFRDCAIKYLPIVSGLLIENDDEVRSAAFVAADCLLNVLRGNRGLVGVRQMSSGPVGPSTSTSFPPARPNFLPVNSNLPYSAKLPEPDFDSFWADIEATPPQINNTSLI